MRQRLFGLTMILVLALTVAVNGWGPPVVIDPGHGGHNGGKFGSNGDGHFLYSSSICIVDTEAKTIQVVTNLMDGEAGEVFWSPVAPQFVAVSAKLGGVVLWHR
jgi:hypothetical protein